MTDSENFYQDEERGEFCGNILVQLSALFPTFVASKMCDCPPLECRWLLTVRTLRDGSVGYLFATEPQIVSLLQQVFDELYKGFARDVHYPTIYNEGYGGELPMVCLGLPGTNRVSVWLKGKTTDEAGGAEPGAAADRPRE